MRLAEIYESVKIIEQALDGLPEGPHITDDRKIALPPRHELATSMEALIHHFKLVTEGFRVPPGEVYYPIESPRGELGCFVRSDGSSKPARVHMRDPSFVNLQATAPMVRGAYIADLIATLAMLDPILGGIDRMSDSRVDCAVDGQARSQRTRRGIGARRAARGRLATRTARACPAGTRPRTSRRIRRASRTPPWSRCPRSCAPRSRRRWRATRTGTRPRCRRSPRPSAATAGARRRRSSRSPA